MSAPCVDSAAPVESRHSALPAPAQPSARPSLLDRIKPYVLIARLDHWFKNGFMALGVLLACFYYPALIHVDSLYRVLWALLTTCLVASSNYVINEILDAPTDLNHPVKRSRPIPSGQVRIVFAYLEWIGLGVCGLLMAYAVNWSFFCSSLALLVMGWIYNVRPIRSKEIPYVDVLSESINNPIRLLLGWFALTDAELPPLCLLLSYWMIGAFFMAAKRFAEYRSFGDAEQASAYRASFRGYNDKKLLLSMFYYVIAFALFLGVFIIRYHVELILMFPAVAAFVCCYLRIAFKRNSAAQYPERLYRERGLMAYLVLSVAAFATLMFVQIPVCYDWFRVQPSSVRPLWKLGTISWPLSGAAQP